MKDTDQIAARLASDLFGTDCTERELQAIKAAIEKATDPFRERINSLVSELDTIWHEGRTYEQKFGVKPHASETDQERYNRLMRELQEIKHAAQPSEQP